MKFLLVFIYFILIGFSNYLFSEEDKSVLDSLKTNEQNQAIEDSVPNTNSHHGHTKQRLGIIDAIDFNWFLWYGKFTGNLTNYFTNPAFIGLNIDVYKNRILYQIDDMVAFGTILTKKTMTFSNNFEVKNHVSTDCATGSLNIGYELIDNDYITLVPLAGAGVFSVSSSNNANTNYEPTNWSYKLGVFIDCKSLATSRKNTPDNYHCIRFSLGFTSLINNTIYPQYFKGSMISFSIGIIGRGNIKHKK